MYTTFYPTNVVTRTNLPAWVDDVDDVEAKVVNDPVTELIVTQLELGQLPKGSHATVKARLDAIEMTSKARGFHTGAPVAVVTGTWTKIVLNGESYDALGEFDHASTYRFTATKSGYYQINAAYLLNLTTTGHYFRIAVRKNGTAYITANFSASIVIMLSAVISDVIPLAVDDYLELYIYHNAGANRSYYAGSDDTFMSIHQLS